MKTLDLPDEVTETKNENGNTGELNGLLDGAVEGFHVEWEGRGKSKRTETLGERDTGGSGDGKVLPLLTPVQWIMGVVGWLWDEHTRVALDEVMGTDICHDLCSGDDLSLEFSLDLVQLLQCCQ